MKVLRVRFLIVASLVCTLLLASVPASAVKPKDSNKLPFEPTEELVYDGEISRLLLRGINVAELRFRASRTQAPANNQTLGKAPSHLRFNLEAVTKGLLVKLFKLNFRLQVESTVEPTSFSVLQTTKLDVQGKRKRTSEAIFDQSTHKVVWTERDPNDPAREPRVVTSEWSGSVQDIASAFYYLRTQPLEVGKSFEILVSDSGNVFRVPLVVTEKKKMNTVLGKVQTLRVDAEIFGEGRLIHGKGKMTIWFTDDARRVPVRARINNELGTLDIKLKSVNPGTSKSKS